VTRKLQRNKPDASYKYVGKPLPLKLYRKELITPIDNTCSARQSLKIDEFNSPNGYLVYKNNAVPTEKGIYSTLDIQIPINAYDTDNKNCVTPGGTCFQPQNDALRRVRSAGMIHKKYNECTNSEKYNTNNMEYLKSRNKTFTQNQFTYKNPVSQAYFHPNNKRFDVQGAVDAGTLINQIKIDQGTLLNNVPV